MDVLLIGGGSRMMDAMIDKFNKSGHRIFLLTGQREKKFSYKHVFEKYRFTYEDDSIKDVLNSVKPDAVVFMGAYDTNFDWTWARQEIVRYTAGLVNILASLSLTGKGRFVYLSSHEVYGVPRPDNIPEGGLVSPKGFKAMALGQGEEICRNYEKAQGMDTLILRLDHVYGVPHRGQVEDNPCFNMCLEALKTGKISADSENRFSMLYLNDAVELAYKAIVDQESKESCYHISSMEEISEMELAQLVAQKMGKGIEVMDSADGNERRLVLDGRKYQERYGQKIFTHYEEGVGKVAAHVKRYSESYLEDADKGGSVKGQVRHGLWTIMARLVPFIENIVCFIPVFLLNGMALDSQFFGRVDFFLLYVLLFALVHGQQQAIFSGLLAVGGYFFQQMYDRTGFDVLMDYNMYVWVAQLFILGMVVGYMRDQLRSLRIERKEEVEFLNGKLEDIADINDSNIRLKQNFETQVVNQRDSLGKIYEITSGLDQSAPEEVLFQAAEILSRIMDSRDVAIYTVANEGYARLFSSTSKDARRMGNSIQYMELSEMMAELMEHRVYVNKTMDESLPLMASAVYEGKKMRLIFMLWDIPWQRMTLSEANRLSIVGQLIQNAVVRADNYMDTLQAQRYVQGTKMLNAEAFQSLVKAFFEAKEKDLTECAFLEILVEPPFYKEAAVALNNNMRETDYMGILQDGKLYVLLANTDEKGAGFVMERFQTAGYQSRLGEGIGI